MKIHKFIIITLLLSCLGSHLLAQQTNGQRTTYITGTINAHVRYDTVSLVLHGPFFSYQTHPEKYSKETLTAVVKNGRFAFKIVTENSPFHISLFLSSKRNNSWNQLENPDISNYLIGAGDSVHVTFDGQSKDFSGKGAMLFMAQYQLEQADRGGQQLKGDTPYEFDKNLGKWLAQKDSLLGTQLKLLSKFQSKISPMGYAIVRADAIASNRTFVYDRISYTRPFRTSGNMIGRDLDSVCKVLINSPDYIDITDRAALSPKYIYYLYTKLKIEVKYNRIVNNVDVRLNNNYFKAINSRFTGIVRDKLLAWWIMDVSSFGNLQQEYAENALSVMQIPSFVQRVQKLKETFEKGRSVTDYDFKDPRGKTVHLADFRGKVILVDLWFSGCTGCVKVAENMPFVERAFKDHSDIVFISISVDKDKTKWLHSITEKPAGAHYTHYTTPSTVYLYTGGTGDKNAFINKYVPGSGYPQLLIIDKEGKIFSSTPTAPANELARNDLIKELGQALAK